MRVKSYVYRMIGQLLAANRTSTVKFTEGDKPEVFDLIARIKRERLFLLRYPEAYNIYRTVRNVRKVEGQVAEVGTFNGASAKLIAEAKGEKKLFVFDSFEGLPDVVDFDASHFHRGQYKSDFEDVKRYLAAYDDVYVYKGFFPQTNAEAVEGESFAFVHLDVDLYESTLDCLKFFYPRLSRGGALISHDYYAQGVYRAFEEFFSDKPEPLIELQEDQVLIVKL